MTKDIAVVTGASGGLGRAIARVLHEKSQGRLRLALHAHRNPKSAQELSRLIPKSFVVTADLSTGEGRRALLEQVLSQGQPKVLVNNAGIDKPYEAALLIKEESFDRLFSVNLKAPAFLMKLFGKEMMSSGGGVIVNISSALAHHALTGSGLYRATKAALEELTKQFACELGRAQVRVNAVSPGFIETPMTADVPAPVRERIRGAAALQRLATPESVALAVWQLVDNDALTGVVLAVDGGMDL